MRLLFKELKKYRLLITTIAILLVIQAICDLSLPSYTSKIVNVGIQQGGITSGVPEVIREKSLDKISIFLNDEQKKEVLSKYRYLKKEDLNNKEFNELLSKYPLLNEEPIYLLNTSVDSNDRQTIEEVLEIPMLITLGFESGGEMAELFISKLTENMPEGKAEDIEIFQLLKMMPESQIKIMLEDIKEQTKELPETIIKQSGIAFVRQEYEAIGINISRIQSRYILWAGFKMICLAFAVMFLAIIGSFISVRVATQISKGLRSRIFQKVISFSNQEMDEFSTASLITRSTNDIQQVQMLAIIFLRIVLYAPILAIGGIFKILNLNLSMAWVLALGIFMILLLVGIAFSIAMPKFKKMQELVDRVNLVMRETLIGLPVIRAFSTQSHEENRFDQENDKLTRNGLFVNRTIAFMMPMMMLLMNLISILIVWVGAKHINSGTMQIGNVMEFIQYTMQIIMSFLMLTMVSAFLPRASVSAGRINEVLSKEFVIADPEYAERLNEKDRGIVEFKNVSFKYPNAEENVISDINFIAKPGETTAIIGSTGSGKSTLINLIPRFYDVTAGEILVNGVDIRKMKQSDLREKIGYISQKGILFSGTIESNIKFADDDMSDAAMEEAARIAQSIEFIEDKPDQYKDSISQGGTNVSGGQKQRLSIARAIAKKPDIFIFDDSFSALDFKTDKALRKALKKEISNSTVIIVAQRISTIMDAEQIIVLDEGRTVGKGTHRELLNTCDVYRQIASSQLSKEELDYE